jgi:hypothetical protein
MSFRWVMGITLWTLISGPIFSGPREMPATNGRTAAMSPTPKSSTRPVPQADVPPRASKKN